MILYLVRHGESIYNAEGRIQGQSDIPLSPLGHRQSEAVASGFRGAQIDAIYSSPLLRALDTARPLAAQLGLEPRTDKRLMEINAGVFQGLTWSDIHQRFPQAGEAWKSQDPDFRIPEGETRRELMQRAEAVLQSIREADHRTAVVVAHGGVLTAGLKALLRVPAERNPFMLYNGSISMADWQVQFRLVTLNQMEHLLAGGQDLRTKAGDL
jgi:broad specificity phosphatase PhoE